MYGNLTGYIFSCIYSYSIFVSLTTYCSISSSRITVDTMPAYTTEIEMRPCNDVEFFRQFYMGMDRVRVSSGSVGIDLRICEDTVIESGSTMVLNTGVRFKFPPRLYGLVVDRSSIAREGLHVKGGVIDQDYIGEIKVIMTNEDKDLNRILPKGTKIAQMLVLKQPKFALIKSPILDDFPFTERGIRGFGQQDGHVRNGPSTSSDSSTSSGPIWEKRYLELDAEGYYKLKNAETRDEFLKLQETSLFQNLEWLEKGHVYPWGSNEYENWWKKFDEKRQQQEEPQTTGTLSTWLTTRDSSGRKRKSVSTNTEDESISPTKRPVCVVQPTLSRTRTWERWTLRTNAADITFANVSREYQNVPRDDTMGDPIEVDVEEVDVDIDNVDE